MSQHETYFISDLHLGHKKILDFSGKWRGGSCPEEHDEWIIAMWNSVVRPTDKVFVLGDAAFGESSLALLARCHGWKNLVRGNHDKQSTATYLKYFNHVYGLVKWENFWLSHAPIHPAELRGRINMHGHVHHNSIPDDRYLNVCVENLRGIPISATRLRHLFREGGERGRATPDFVFNDIFG